jgi:hypothetical protein
MVVRYYLGSCEFKWTHVGTRMELIWVRREIGDELFEQCNQPGFTLVFGHNSGRFSAAYCDCTIYVEVDKVNKATTMFALKYSHLAEVKQT